MADNVIFQLPERFRPMRVSDEAFEPLEAPGLDTEYEIFPNGAIVRKTFGTVFIFNIPVGG